MKLFEVVKGPKSAPDTLATAMELGRKIGKISAMAGNGDGFVADRSRTPFGTEMKLIARRRGASRTGRQSHGRFRRPDRPVCDGRSLGARHRLSHPPAPRRAEPELPPQSMVRWVFAVCRTCSKFAAKPSPIGCGHPIRRPPNHAAVCLPRAMDAEHCRRPGPTSSPLDGVFSNKCELRHNLHRFIPLFCELTGQGVQMAATQPSIWECQAGSKLRFR
jgi:hypothetical protein